MSIDAINNILDRAVICINSGRFQMAKAALTAAETRYADRSIIADAAVEQRMDSIQKQISERIRSRKQWNVRRTHNEKLNEIAKEHF